MKRKILVTWMAVCMAVSFTACGDSGNNRDAKEASGTESVGNHKDKDDSAEAGAADGDDYEEESNTAESESVENEDINAENGLVDGMRPEFKEAMDSYEVFYDEYCDFMKEYAENPSDLKLLARYTDMLTKDAEMTEKFEAWDEAEMNDAELKYYLDVNHRVINKLLEISE